MTRFPVLCGAVVLTAVLTGCQGQDQSAGGGPTQSSAQPKQSASTGQTAPRQLPDVELPRDAAGLATVLGRQIQAAQSVRFSADTTTRSTAGKTATLELTGVVRRPAGGQQGVATLRTAQTGGSNPGVTETVVVGDTVYTRVEGEEHAPGKPWLRISRQDLTATDLGPTREGFEQVYNESMQAVQEATAGTDLAALAGGKVTKDPVEETLEGVTVRRYVGETGTAKMADRTGDTQLRELAKAGVRTVPWTIWVDSKGLPRRFTMTMTIPGTGTITSRASYSGWGEQLFVTAPPAAQVAALGG
jgi:hypothetical protein